MEQGYPEKSAVWSSDMGANILSGGLSGKINACYECCDRHAAANPDAPALFYEDESASTVFTFGDLQKRATGMADLLMRLGVGHGDCVAALVPRSPELLVAALAAWRIGAIFMPLFTAFGEAAISHRLQQADAAVLIIDYMHLPKVEGLNDLPKLVAVSPEWCVTDTLERWAELGAKARSRDPVAMEPEAPFLRMFTSGTTGKPKSLDVPLNALMAFGNYMRNAVELESEDRFWNLADPGWAYGLYYGLIGPLLLGCPTLFNKQAFDAGTAIQIIQKQQITSLAGSPTAFRLLMAAGPDAVRPIKNQLRVVSSAGEPLTAEIQHWFVEHLGVHIRDHYGQTELGIVLASDAPPSDPDAKPSGGVPLPGFRLVVLDKAGHEVAEGVAGELAVDRAKSPLFFFKGYREVGPLTDRYYRTGDVVELRDDGSIGFVGRIDDVITSSGYRIGPFDVESALTDHPDVFEAGVIGVPDPQRTELVKAFVVLKPGVKATDAMADELQQHVRRRLSAHAYPRIIEFVDSLPKTPSGKLQRHLLKSR